MRMQYRGVPFDKELFEKLQKELRQRIAACVSELEKHAPEHPEGNAWSWGNNQPINEDDPAVGSGRNGIKRALALKGIELPNLKKSTRVEFLASNRKKEPLFEALHRYLIYRKLHNDSKDWIKLHYEGGRLYPGVKFYSQVTGRSAFEKPALQNIPKKDGGIDLEFSLRDCIRTPDSHRIIKADYAAQELRILARITGDEALTQALTEPGSDPHLKVAEHIAGKPLRRGTPEGEKYRKLGKRANFGFAYGSGPKTYQAAVYEDSAERITLKQAKEEREAFRQTWPKVTRWQTSFGSRKGNEPDAWFAESGFGRRRYVGPDSEGKPKYTDRLNAPVQSNGADMLYYAVNLLSEDRAQGVLPGVDVLFTTHDEICLEAPHEVAGEALDWLLRRMRDATRELIGEELASDDCVEGDIGQSWAE